VGPRDGQDVSAKRIIFIVTESRILAFKTHPFIALIEMHRNVCSCKLFLYVISVLVFDIILFSNILPRSADGIAGIPEEVKSECQMSLCVFCFLLGRSLV